MEYGQAMNRNTAADMRSTPVATDARTLDSLLDRLQKELLAIAENTARVSQFKCRLISPRPQGVGEKPVEVPATSSVEGRLQHLIHVAHGIGEHLNETANDLDRAA